MNRRLQEMGSYLGVARPPEPRPRSTPTVRRLIFGYLSSVVLMSVIYTGGLMLFGSHFTTAWPRGLVFSVLMMMLFEFRRRRRQGAQASGSGPRGRQN